MRFLIFIFVTLLQLFIGYCFCDFIIQIFNKPFSIIGTLVCLFFVAAGSFYLSILSIFSYFTNPMDLEEYDEN